MFLTQVLPFADGPSVRVYGDFEKAVYGTLTAVTFAGGDPTALLRLTVPRPRRVFESAANVVRAGERRCRLDHRGDTERRSVPYIRTLGGRDFGRARAISA